MVLSGHKLSPYHFAEKVVPNTSSTMRHSFQMKYHMKRDIFFSDFRMHSYSRREQMKSLFPLYLML